MASGPDLPLELLPEILGHLPKVHYLTKTALVNQVFYQSTIPKLYVRASIYSWHREPKLKVLQLFRTLASCPHLARYVRRLEIRDFPKHELTEAGSENVLQGLRNCTNLHSCTWTRDGSLTSNILYTLSNPSSLPESSYALRELEINGHHSDLYDAKLLLKFQSLTRVSIIMPTLEVIQVLEEWVKVLEGTFKSLNLFCKMSPLVTDDTLIRMAPFLKNLEELHLTGCPKVTHRGIRAVLAENEKGIVNLALEGVSPRLNLAQLVPTSSTTSLPAFHNLRSLTLSIPPLTIPPPPTTQTSIPPMGYLASRPGLSEYTTTLHSLITSNNTPHLEKFQIYSPHMFFEPCDATSELFRGLVREHGERLKRISVHRMLIGMDVIRDICLGCVKMEEIFIVAEPGSLDALADCIHLGQSLRTVHVNYPLEAQAGDGSIAILRYDEALNFVRRCANPALMQFGCNARVWQVNREISVKDDGGKESEVYLAPYESPDIPEQFSVVRT